MARSKREMRLCPNILQMLWLPMYMSTSRAVCDYSKSIRQCVMLHIDISSKSVMQFTGGYAALLGLTKVPDITKKISASPSGQLSSCASDSATDVCKLADTASEDSLPRLAQDLYATAGHNRQTSQEMPTSISSTNISLNFDRTCTKPHGHMQSKTVSNRARVTCKNRKP